MRSAFVFLLCAIAAPAHAQLQGQVYASGFQSPVAFVQDPTDRAVQFVVQQAGRIRVVRNGTVLGTDFLNLTSSVGCCGERGLLGLAFAPDYASSGRFFVNFTNNAGDTVIARFLRSSNSLIADSSSRFDLQLEGTRRVITQPFSNHNGGHLAFGPDGYLYIGLGDGGLANDPLQVGQDMMSWLGKFLRIDVDNPDGNKAYGVPKDNPFASAGANPGGGQPEIWALGLRNPWRFSFDSDGGDLYIGDVGQGSWEEIDRKGNGKGVNFGWPLLEGNHYYDYPGQPSGERCTSGCRSRPILAYAHAVSGEDNNTVVGGYVARRPGRPLTGKYIFGDFGSGRVWAIRAGFDRGDSLPAPLANTNHTISSFGVDNLGRVYLVDYGGSVWRLTDT